MTEIVFIYPPLRRGEVYGPFENAENVLPPLGIASLAAVCREAGKTVSIVDAVAERLSLEETARRVAALRPAAAGISAATVGIENAGRLAGLLKEALPRTAVIVGGPHVTAVPGKTLSLFGAIDVAVIGEGERTILDLLDTLGRGGDLSTVRGIAFRREGGVTVTPPRPFVEDLDSLPIPAYDLLPDLARLYRPAAHNFKRLPSTSMITSRGCPGRCIFCDLKTFGNRCRRNSIPYTMRVVERLISDFGIRDVRIPDDTFVIDRAHVLSFCGEIVRRGLDISWSCQARVNLVDPELLRAMRRAGCWQVDYGIESGSRKILETLRKGITPAQALRALRWTRDAGIQAKGYFMIGSPGETPETIRETIAFARKAALDSFQVSFFTPFPGSPVYDEIARHGVLEEKWGSMSIWNPVFVPHGMTKGQLVDASRRALRSFYLRPRTILRYLTRIRTMGGLRDVARSGLLVMHYIFARRGGGAAGPRREAPSPHAGRGK